MSKLRMRTRTWDVIVVVTVLLLLVVGWGGLFVLRDEFTGDARATLTFLVVLGVVTVAFFAGPGIVYALHKRIPFLKRRLPGDTIAWIRAHMYLPVLALVAAYIHATAAPFRDTLSSGKLTLAVAVLVALAGVVRHHLIGVQQRAQNVDVEIGKLSARKPAEFRALVRSYREGEQTLEEADAAVAGLTPDEQTAWSEIRALSLAVEKHFPRSGGQRPAMRQYKVWRAVHVPLTIALFVLIAFHVADVLGAGHALDNSTGKAFASSAECRDCHSQIYDEWSRSALAHAQTSQLMLAQLPVTLSENAKLADELGIGQQRILRAFGKVCLNCHAQVGSRFAPANGLLPLAENGAGGHPAVSGGNAAVESDGVGCIVCHTQVHAPPVNGGNGQLAIGTRTALDYGTQYGPLFDDPKPLPVRVHNVGSSALWSDGIASSQLCGACHNVALDLDGDGKTGLTDVKDDLVLQTTFEEWQNYLDAFSKDSTAATASTQGVKDPLGCVECHMPSQAAHGVVDYAPGIQSVPNRASHSHAFVGVDYDLAPGAYGKGVLDRVLAERKALLQSAVTLQVVDPGTVSGDTYTAQVVVQNNNLGHQFPTGFAFARQFWLEVSARTSSGQGVPLVAPPGFAKVPDTSGRLSSPTADLPQCDGMVVAFKGAATPVDLAAAFPAGSCDPWLVNFQKILTDGDPKGTGQLTEVPYQSLLPQIVATRVRTVDQTPINALLAARVGAGGQVLPADGASFGYVFDTRGLRVGEKIIVTAKLRFRHVPPDFVKALAKRVRAVKDAPDSARIDAAQLLKQLVVTDVAQASSAGGPVLDCRGPQNTKGASILDCVASAKKR